MMMRRLSFFSVFCSVALPACLAAQQAQPEPPGELRLRGFGSWAAGVSDGNAYQFSDADGEYDAAELTLVATARPAERLKLFAQIHLDATSDEVDTVIDYLLAEWTVRPTLALRVGRAHHPFGIYGESFRIGTLRPFTALPQGVYGTSGMIGENFNGLALRGTREGRALRTFRYDLYAGNVEIRISRPWIVLRDPSFAPPPELSDINEVIGARIEWGEEIGWRLGLSMYDGKQESGSGGRVPAGDHTVIGAHGEYTSGRWWIRGELARHEHLDALTLDGSYLEIAYRFTDRWQLAARLDRAEIEIDRFDVSAAPSLWEHDDLGLALSYWPTQNVVVRLEAHAVDGNRFALPDDLAGAIAGGTLEPRTDLLQVAAQFTF